MTAPRSAPRRPADDNLHPIHRADRRHAEIRRDAQRVLLGVGASILAAQIVSILVIMVRP